MNGQEGLALAIVIGVAFLQVRSWIGGGKRAARGGGAACGSCSGCSIPRAAGPGGGTKLTPASQGTCH